MAEIVKDQVFGEMEYKHRWVKKELITLLGNDNNVSIVAAAYTGDSIIDNQREAYKYFKQHINEINNELPHIIKKYVECHKDEIEEHYKLESVDKAIHLVKPTSILFTRDGKAIIMCNVAWDEENGIGIEVFPKFEIDLQDAYI